MSKRTNALFPLFKDKYEHEIQRRRYFDNVINLPVTLIAFLVAGIYIVISDTSVPQWFTMPKIALVTLVLICIILSFWFLFQLYFKSAKQYAAFPDSKSVQTRYDTLEALLAADPDRDKKIKEQFNTDIEGWYVDSNTQNTKVNDGRGDLFAYLNMLISAGYFFGIVLFVVFWIAKSNPATKEVEKAKQVPRTVSIQTTIIKQETAAVPAPKLNGMRKRKTYPAGKHPITKEPNCKKNGQGKKDLQSDSTSRN